MKGYKRNPKTGKWELIEDGLPFPETPLYEEPEPPKILNDEEHDALLGLLEGPGSLTPVRDIRIALEILIEAICRYDRKE